MEERYFRVFPLPLALRREFKWNPFPDLLVILVQGFITSDEFLSIPELSINPLSKRLAYFYDGINFKDFVKMLAPYSPKASREDKIKHLFAIWDVDGDGFVSSEDMELIIRQAAGSSLTSGEVDCLVKTVLKTAGGDKCSGLELKDFHAALKNAHVGLLVEIPID